METCGCHKTKERTEEEVKRLINRLNRVEGQIRGRHPGPGGRRQRGAERLRQGAALRSYPHLRHPGHPGGQGRDGGGAAVHPPEADEIKEVPLWNNITSPA